MDCHGCILLRAVSAHRRYRRFLILFSVARRFLRQGGVAICAVRMATTAEAVL
jgi:hypothetical protein